MMLSRLLLIVAFPTARSLFSGVFLLTPEMLYYQGKSLLGFPFIIFVPVVGGKRSMSQISPDEILPSLKDKIASDVKKNVSRVI